MSQPFKLYRLQQTDSQLDQARSRLQKILLQLKDDTLLRQAEKRLNVAEEQVRGAQKDLRQAEDEVKAQQIKIEQTEATLYGGKVRNPKELQDLQNESAALNRYLVVLEDRQLESMLALEDVEIEQKNAQANYHEVQARVSEAREKLSMEQKQLEEEIERLESERAATASTISDEDIQLYEQLRVQRRGVAVAKVSDGACSACGSTLTPGTVQSARSPSSITRCTFCGRILYSG